MSKAESAPSQKLDHADSISSYPQQRPASSDPWLPTVLRVGQNTSLKTLKWPRAGTFGGSHTIKSSPFSPSLGWLKSRVTSAIRILRSQEGIHHVLSQVGEGEAVGWGCATRKKGRTEQIRDLSHQQDNRGRVTKGAGSLAGAWRERKSILKFKQSPPQGKHPGSLSQPAPLISSSSHQVHINRNDALLAGLGLYAFFFFFVTHLGSSSWHIGSLEGVGSLGLLKPVAFQAASRQDSRLG